MPFLIRCASWLFAAWPLTGSGQCPSGACRVLMSRFGSGHDAAFFFHAPQSARGAAAGGAGSAVRAGGAQRLGFGLFAAGAAGGAGHGRAAASKRGAGGACRSFAGAHWGGVSDQLHGGHCAGGGGGAVPAGGRPDGRAAGADAAAGVVAGHRQCHANQHHRAGFVFFRCF